MNKIETILKNSKNKTVLFLGNFLHIMQDDLKKFTKELGFEFATKYNDTQDIALVVLSSILNPIQEEQSYSLYNKNIPDCTLIEFESFYAKSIKPNALLMSLKLSNNQDRVISFLKSEAIDNDLYLKLFKLYNYNFEGLFDTNNNRDVTLSFINRFYKPLTQVNHTDIAHSPATLIEITLTTTNKDALEAIFNMPNYEIKAKKHQEWKPKNLKEFVALNPYISKDLIKHILSLKSHRYDMLLAINPAIDFNSQLTIYNRATKEIKQALSTNTNLDIELFKLLLSEDTDIVKSLLKSQPISSRHLSLIKSNYYIYLASNPNIKEVIDNLINISKELDIELSKNSLLQQSTLTNLYLKYKEDIFYNITQNPNTSPNILEEIYKSATNDLILNIAKNPNTPSYIIDELFNKDNIEVNRALALNSNLKDEYLDYFKLDNQLLQIMSKNSKFLDKVSKKVPI